MTILIPGNPGWLASMLYYKGPPLESTVYTHADKATYLTIVDWFTCALT
jgi:hypothetical protein